VLIKTLVFSLILFNIVVAQTTPYIKFQVTPNSDLFIAYSPTTYTWVSDTGDTLYVTKINELGVIFNDTPDSYIELETDKRMEMGVGYALIYKRKISDPYIKTPYYTFFGFCPAYIQPISVQQPIEIK